MPARFLIITSRSIMPLGLSLQELRCEPGQHIPPASIRESGESLLSLSGMQGDCGACGGQSAGASIQRSDAGDALSSVAGAQRLEERAVAALRMLNRLQEQECLLSFHD